MKKYLIGLFCGGLLSLPALSEQIIFWPGYINNAECLNGSKECGKDSFKGIFRDGAGTFYIGRGLFSDRVSDQWWPNSKNNVDKLTFKVSLRFAGIDHNRTIDTWDGIPLRTSNGESSNYWLKGITRGGASSDYMIKVRVNKCNWDGQTCTDSGEWVDLEYAVSDITGAKQKDIVLTGNQRIGTVEAWTNNKTVPRLFLKRSSNTSAIVSDDQVRSLYLPGIVLDAYLYPVDRWGTFLPQDGVPSMTNLRIMRHAHARLNHRQCTLTPSSREVDFKSISVSDLQVGKVSSEIPITFKLECGGYEEKLVNGGTEKLAHGKPCDFCDPTAPDMKKQTVRSTNVVNVIQRVWLEGVPEKNIEGKPRIALKNKDLSNIESENLYVEGSLTQGNQCGVDAIELNANLASLNQKIEGQPGKDDPVTKDNFSTIYWKICKTAGEAKSGNYEGMARFNIQFR